VVNPAGRQVFFGSTGARDTIAANIGADSRSGTIIGYLAGTSQGFVVNFQLNADGTFTAPATTFGSTTTGIISDGGSLAAPGTPRVAALTGPLTFQGTVVNGVLSGTIVELGLPFNANGQAPSGPTAGVAGYYQAASTNTTTGNTYSIVGTDGRVYVLAVTPTIVAADAGTLTAANTFDVQASQNATITGSINQSTTTVTGTITVPGQAPTNFTGLANTTTWTDR